ncbi:hypothetical protein ACFQ14_09605 [Pseudahrensia aquimaris]|uniref:Uncharacterized protein n=1 Tax=Pseudahrensia aquimaris TaxID=744461 RepID=A0ABW3FIS5_9HYPH
MARLSTLLTAAALAAAASSPAFAEGCGWGKMAKHEQTMAEVKTPEATEEAVTTFDPAEKPVFEEVAKAETVTVEDVPAE